MSRSIAKAERVREMERLYYQRAYSDVEMGQRFGVDRSTIFRDRTELEAEVPITQDEDGRYRIDRNKYLSSIRVNLTEALSLYLAARRASQQTRYAQRYTASALEKLAMTLRQPMTERLVKAASVILMQQSRPEREAVLTTVAEAWVQGFCLRITYQGLQSRHTFQHTVRPYLLEPSPWSDSVYLIGYSDRMAKVAIFKLDRIERAAMTGEQFTLPADFDEEQMLRFAWGIWGGDEEPMTVTLRFAPGIATRRVKETIWHPLERITDTEDGGCIWEAEIAEWREMLPWVRGWGASVKILAPTEMSEVMIGEARALARLYGLDDQKTQRTSTIDNFFGG
jgi:CRISPR-associated endonuclease/helicase Cas3